MAKPRLPEDMDLTIVNIKKWLKIQKVGIELDIPGENIPDGLTHGILFLDYLRSSRHFPGRLTASEASILKVFASLCAKIDPSASGIAAGSDLAAMGAHSKKNEDTKENDPKGNARTKHTGKNGNDEQVEKAGSKKTVRKLAPLSEAMKNLNIQENKGCSCKGVCKTKVCGCQKKAIKCSQLCKCHNKCVNKLEEKNDSAPVTKEENVCQSRLDESSDDTGSEDDFARESVDWDRHLTSLVECKKCSRKFFPNRVEFHMQVCKGLIV